MPLCGFRPNAAVMAHNQIVTARTKLIEIASAVRALPSPARQAVSGAIILGLVGTLVGLVVGLVSYPPTAWAAAFELGFPATALGLIGGLVVGLIARVLPSARR
jgi:hypothetical protein